MARAAASNASARAPSPVTTISRGAQPQIDGVEQRHVHVEIIDRRRRDGGDQPVGFLPPAHRRR